MILSGVENKLTQLEWNEINMSLTELEGSKHHTVEVDQVVKCCGGIRNSGQLVKHALEKPFYEHLGCCRCTKKAEKIVPSCVCYATARAYDKNAPYCNRASLKLRVRMRSLKEL